MWIFYKFSHSASNSKIQGAVLLKTPRFFAVTPQLQSPRKLQNSFHFIFAVHCSEKTSPSWNIKLVLKYLSSKLPSGFVFFAILNKSPERAAPTRLTWHGTENNYSCSLAEGKKAITLRNVFCLCLQHHSSCECASCLLLCIGENELEKDFLG